MDITTLSRILASGYQVSGHGTSETRILVHQLSYLSPTVMHANIIMTPINL